MVTRLKCSHLIAHYITIMCKRKHAFSHYHRYTLLLFYSLTSVIFFIYIFVLILSCLHLISDVFIFIALLTFTNYCIIPNVSSNTLCTEQINYRSKQLLTCTCIDKHSITTGRLISMKLWKKILNCLICWWQWYTVITKILWSPIIVFSFIASSMSWCILLLVLYIFGLLSQFDDSVTNDSVTNYSCDF